MSLRAPFPPTSSPLQSSLALVRETLVALRQRCAPIRDPEIDQLIAGIDFPSTPSHISDPTSANRLAYFLVTTLKSLVALAEVLKNDLTQSVLGTMSDVELTNLVRAQALARERKITLDGDVNVWVKGDIGGDPQDRIKALRKQWRDWVSIGQDVTTSWDWTSRLIQALASPVPVSCPPFDTTENVLPSLLFFTGPSLLYIQNYLQALVIAASLNSLIRVPIKEAPTPSASDFMVRVWDLLKAELDKEAYANSVMKASAPESNADMETKLINLADEVVRARRMFPTPPTAAEESDLRVAVERTLRFTDPVFVLLHGRLKGAIEMRIRRPVNLDSSAKVNLVDRETGVPDKIRTGRGRLSNEPSFNRQRLEAFMRAPIKGFEDQVLVKGIEELGHELIKCIEWVEDVWGDVM